MPRTKRPACGSKELCCHIGYAHRHCEHCDQVISLVSWSPYVMPWVNPLPVRPYQPYWTYGTYNTFGDVANAAAAGGINHQFTIGGSQTAPALPSAHLCEVK